MRSFLSHHSSSLLRSRGKKNRHFCSSAAFLLFFNIFRQEYCILSWCVKVREINPERSVRGIQNFWAVKGLCGSALTFWKTEENPGEILALMLDMEDLLEGCEMGAGIHRNLKIFYFLNFYHCFLIFGCCFFHVSKIDAFPSKITEFLRLEKSSQSPTCAWSPPFFLVGFLKEWAESRWELYSKKCQAGWKIKQK